MADNWLIEQRIDLRRGVQAPQVWPHALMLRGDNNAHTWRVIVLDGGEPAQITGNITGYFVRADGNTVVVTGELSGHIASVTLAQACYAIQGDLRAVMRLKVGESTITLSALILHVRSEISDSIIDPGEVIPSLDDLLAQIDACEEATDAANDAADAANQAAQSASAVESDIESAEAARVTAEQGRVAAEQARAAAEAERVANEDERQQQLTDAINAAEADADRAEAAADAAETLIAMPPLFSDTPPADEPTLNKLWVDTGVSPTMMRRWRGADVPTEREYTETRVGCGKNLLPLQTPQTRYGVTIAVQADGGVHISGTCTAASGPVTFEYPVNMTLDGEFTLSMGNSQAVADHLQMRLTDGPGATLYDANGTSSNITAQNANSAVTLELIHQYVDGWIIRVGGGETYDVTLYPRLERGETATAFEPYEDVPFLALDNAQGQIENVTVEAGCRARQAGTGEPSPENIRAITGRESVEIAACGKNLLRIPPTLGPATGASAVEVSGDGYTVSVTGSGAWAQSGVVYLDVIPGKTYTASVQSISGGNAAYVAIQDASASSGSGSIASVSANTPNLQTAFAAPSDGIRVVFVANATSMALESPTTATFNGVMIEEGDTATEYEPYRSMGGGTVTPTEPLYGLPGAEDTVEVSVDGDVTVTRRTAVLTLDGTENWYAGAAANGKNRWELNFTFDAKLPTSAQNAANMICTHYESIPANATYSGQAGISFGTGTKYIGIFDDQFSDVASFKAYLAAQKTAGTPVTIVYELATPTTETPVDVDPIVPEKGQLNIYTDANALSATVHGSGWDTISDQTGLLATIAQLTARVAALEQAAVNESTGG